MTTFLAVLITTISAQAAGAAPRSVWKLEQVAESEGALTILISAEGIKVTCPHQNLICVFSAPKWNVVSYNPKEKLINSLTLEQWIKHGTRLFGKKQFDNLTEKSKARSLWQGNPIEEVTAVVAQSDPLKEKYEMFYRESEGRSLQYSSEKFVYEKFIKLDSAQKEFFGSFYGVPPGNGLLFQRTRIYPHGRKDLALRTLSCKKVTVDSTEFDFPKNFKTVGRVKEVTMESRKLEQAGTMLEDILGK